MDAEAIGFAAGKARAEINAMIDEYLASGGNRLADVVDWIVTVADTPVLRIGIVDGEDDKRMPKVDVPEPAVRVLCCLYGASDRRDLTRTLESRLKSRPRPVVEMEVEGW